MANVNKTFEEINYSTMEKGNVNSDFEEDSESTLSLERPPKTKRDLDRPKRRARRQESAKTLVWLRWGTIVVLQSIIVLQLLRNGGQIQFVDSTRPGTETGGDINGLYVTKSHEYTTSATESDKFMPNMSSDADRLDIRKNWDMLLPLGSGSVSLPNYKDFPLLGQPIVNDVYEAAWTHALHCLYFSVDTYHQMVVNNRFGFSGERNDVHAIHCFEYLRLQILCMADMTLEGAQSEIAATGPGQARVCRNRAEAVSWIESRRVDDGRSILGT